MLNSFRDHTLIRIFAYTGPLEIDTVCRRWHRLVRSDALYTKILSMINKSLEGYPFKHHIQHLISHMRIDPSLFSQGKEEKHTAIFYIFTRLMHHSGIKPTYGILGFKESLLTIELLDLEYLAKALQPAYGEIVVPRSHEDVSKAVEVLSSLKKPEDRAVTVNLTNYRIMFIKPFVFSSLQITTLDISDCNLTFLPDYVLAAKRIVYLNLRKNKITELPDEFATLECLETLDIALTPLSIQNDKIQYLRENKSLKIIHTQ